MMQFVLLCFPGTPSPSSRFRGRLAGAALLATCLLSVPVRAQIGAPPHPAEADSSPAVRVDDVLQSYVDRAHESNHALQQQQIDLERSFAALREARGAFLPTLDLEARYSRAEGGRSIDFPAGDLLNPVYSTLNELTGAQRFPPTENVSDPFLRKEEQETQLRFEQPIFVPRILHNYRANKHQVAAQKAAVEALKQEVTRDVKVAYFNYLQAQRAVDVLHATEQLTEENLRTNRRLLQRAKVTRDLVLRAKADVMDIRQQRIEAEKDRNLARSYLNFLMNRPLDGPIRKPDEFDQLPVPSETPSTTDVLQTALGSTAGTSRRGVRTSLRSVAEQDLQKLQEQAVEARPELRQLDRSIAAAENGVHVAQASYWPEVVLAVDAGIQGTSYSFEGDNPFVLGSVVLRWNLFNGFRDAARLEQARLREKQLRSRQDEVTQQIRREVEQALEKVRVARTSLAAATERAKAARESFRLTRRRHEEGMTNQVTLVDARTTRTDAELNLSSTRYAYLKRLAQLEYAVGTARPYAASTSVQSSSTGKPARPVEPSDTTRYERFGLEDSRGG
jgi:outer membrane protein TolC